MCPEPAACVVAKRQGLNHAAATSSEKTRVSPALRAALACWHCGVAATPGSSLDTSDGAMASSDTEAFAVKEVPCSSSNSWGALSPSRSIWWSIKDFHCNPKTS
mmetsp:Transcript_22310/g.63302  ORF Transcript_22310/g.63302 Transcript_22310/m.63302 type:complete len:104 (-) Transcript_22310:13-324(-)